MNQFYKARLNTSESRKTTKSKEGISFRNLITGTRHKAKAAILYAFLFVLAAAITGQQACAQTWTSQSSTTTNDINSIDYGNGIFLGVGRSGTVVTSTNGTSWSSRTISATGLDDAVYTGSQWIVVGDNGVVYTSPNGSSWTSQTSGVAGATLFGVATSGSLTVAVSDQGDVIRSTDGVSWAKTNLPTQLYSIAYANGIFVAVGAAGSIYTSPDGVSWTGRTAGNSNDYYRINYGNHLFVVVGDAAGTGFVMTSPDGTNWTSRSTPGGTGTLSGVAYAGGKFVAAGYGGTIISSADGVSWTKENSGTTNDLYDVAWGGSQFAAAGFAGTILTQGYTALPLTWLSFSATQKNKAAELKWTTAAEMNTEDFVVQYSLDAFHWNNLGFVKAAGNSIGQQTYSFVHTNPANGTNLYRLIQRDMDGRQQYSGIVRLEFQPGGGFALLQNPVNSVLLLQFPSVTKGEYLLQLTDITGKLIEEQKVNKGTGVYSLDIHNLVAGQYLVVVSAGNWKEAKQFIKQ